MEGIEFSDKERMIIKDVKRQNFYTRAMPLSLGCIVGCHVLMRRGIVGTTRPFIRYFVFGSIGYACGIVSLPRQLKERLLNESPDGQFAKLIKQMEHMSKEEKDEFIQKAKNAYSHKSSGLPNTVSPPQPVPQAGGVQNQGTLDLFPQQTPTTALDNQKTPAPESGKSTTTPEPSFSYRQQRMRPSNQTEGQLKAPPGEEVKSISQDPNRRVRRNQYGDEME